MNVLTLQFVPKQRTNKTKRTDGPELVNDLTLSRAVKVGEKPIRNVYDVEEHRQRVVRLDSPSKSQRLFKRTKYNPGF